MGANVISTAGPCRLRNSLYCPHADRQHASRTDQLVVRTMCVLLSMVMRLLLRRLPIIDSAVCGGTADRSSSACSSGSSTLRRRANGQESEEQVWGVVVLGPHCLGVMHAGRPSSTCFYHALILLAVQCSKEQLLPQA